MLIRSVAAAMMILSGLLNPSNAQVVAFDNVGPGAPFEWQNQPFYKITGVDHQLGPPWYTMGFIPTVSGNLHSLFIAIVAATDFNPALVILRDDVFSQTWSEQWGIDSDDWGHSGIDLTPKFSPFLNAGQIYYLTVWGHFDQETWWHKSQFVDDLGPVGISTDEGQSWDFTDELRGAFTVRVVPSAVPEPSSLVLLAGAAPVGLFLWRRRYTASQQSSH
jgi:hypothetical protein